MRLLVLTDDPSAETKLHEPLEEIAGGEELEERIVLVDPDDEDLAAAASERFGLPVSELSAG